ncbi:carboxypeptidase-like regulatory domain-containing protein [Flavobacterium silvaticum]|uniref:Carboxypeptidase-like regulatory domain-containing protein n=1 Tax=Flavobacterium silvaticum TaxID=1852020 RepID=A0A972JED9_9FLAO|nr:carboxypeptidase-like regulatory domain-containing protein [Flavobacterium silvaticum]NMH26774.1 carboxypeptidase-like regulatory domain-containing protein [Flavobacterium silvaticum]
MRSFTVFLFLAIATSLFAQKNEGIQKISGVVSNDATLLPLMNANIVNLNKVKGAVTDERGRFEIEAEVNDTLHVSLIGFQPLMVRVTNDWIRNKTATISLTEKAIALEEVIIQPYRLTGYLEVDTKLIPIPENYRYSISGLPQGYEAGAYSPGAFGKVMGSLFNPADALYNFFGKKPAELKKLREYKKDENVRNLLESKYDRETVAALLGVDKSEIPEILARCNYSESFAKTANDLQVMEAISECYEEYKILKKKN